MGNQIETQKVVALRDYQNALVDDLRNNLRLNRRVLVQLPTGGGKTAIAAFIAGETAARARQVYFICHRAELVHQTSLTFTKFRIPHAFIAAGRPMHLRQHVQLCSIDTLKNRVGDLREPAVVIWDECHHLGAAGWMRVMQAWPNARHVGLSATPTRLDGRGLDQHFDAMVRGPSVAELMAAGHLSPYRVYAPSSPDMIGARKVMGDFSKADSAARMDKPKLIGDAVDHWRRFADGARTVVFAINVDHSQRIARRFTEAGIAAAHLDGGTPKAERAAIIRRYAAGEIKVLCNVDLFGEGFDLSAIAQRDVTIDCVMLMRPTQSLALHLQQVGRCLRPAPGKIAIIIDHAGNSQRHGFPDDDREWTLEGRTKAKKAANDNAPPPPVTCDFCFMQIRRPLPPHCPGCGKLLQVQTAEVKVAEGELKLQTEDDKRAIRQSLMREQAEAKDVAALAALGARRGYKNPVTWANKVFAGRRR